MSYNATKSRHFEVALTPHLAAKQQPKIYFFWQFV